MLVRRHRRRVLVAGLATAALIITPLVTAGGAATQGLATPESAASPPDASAPTTSTAAAKAATPPRLSVSGNAFRINETSTRLAGQSLIVVLTPAGLTSGGKPVRYPRSVADAKALYRSAGSPRDFFEQVRDWAEGTNVVRLQVSQFGLAAERESGDPVCHQRCRQKYLGRVAAAVRGAKTAGLVVILSMQYHASPVGATIAGGGCRPRRPTARGADWLIGSPTTGASPSSSTTSRRGGRQPRGGIGGGRPTGTCSTSSETGPGQPATSSSSTGWRSPNAGTATGTGG